MFFKLGCGQPSLSGSSSKYWREPEERQQAVGRFWPLKRDAFSSGSEERGISQIRGQYVDQCQFESKEESVYLYFITRMAK
jgi:hypothetical protein